MSPSKSLTFTAIAVVLVVGVLEAGLRFAFASEPIANRLLKSYDETSWRIGWVNRRHRGIEVLYGFDRYDASKGWSLVPGLRDLDVFDGKILNTNRRRYRGRTDYRRKKPEDVKRIVVLEDSFTFGDEVSDGETYSDYLQEQLDGVEIINLGVHGYGHDQMLIVLEELGTRLRPDIVLLGFIYDDVARNGLAFRDYAKPYFR